MMLSPMAGKVLVSLFLVFILLLCHGDPALSSSSSLAVRRHKRSLTDLKYMLRAVIRNHDPSDFIGYGNYCGMSGSGAALDAVDECCNEHDKCYTALRDNSVCAFVFGFRKYFASYKWQMTGGAVECDNTATQCGYRLCSCDRDVVHCFSRNLHAFNPVLRRNRSLFRQILDFAHESLQYSVKPRVVLNDTASAAAILFTGGSSGSSIISSNISSIVLTPLSDVL